MSNLNHRDMRTTPDEPAGTPTFTNKQKLEIDQRRVLAHRYRAGGGPPLDPVLRFHLGLDNIAPER